VKVKVQLSEQPKVCLNFNNLDTYIDPNIRGIQFNFKNPRIPQKYTDATDLLIGRFEDIVDKDLQQLASSLARFTKLKKFTLDFHE